jgi:hypothetical protein
MAGESRLRLDSWKEIAKFLNRDLSTVRRWEKEKGLPVHRVPGGSRHAVFAFSDEIESWMLSNPDESKITQGNRPALLEGAAPRVLAATLGVLLLLALVTARINRPGVLHRATFEEDRILAWDDAQRVTWSYPFRSRLLKLSPEQAQRRIRILDLTGDGKPEVLAAVSFAEAGNGKTPSDEVLCFSQTGELLWKYQPDVVLDIGGSGFRGPWILNDWLIPEKQFPSSVWAAFAHSTWWPSFVVRIETGGLSRLQFVNSGWITVLNYTTNSQGQYLLAGGVNNESGNGFFAALDISGPPTSSPQTPRTSYYCAACPKEPPHRYFLFSRSELNVLESAPPNIIRLIRVFDSRIEVRTAEIPDQYSIFEFSPDFSLRSISMSDRYWELHQRLEKSGKLHHSAEVCRKNFAGVSARAWSPGLGWTEIRAETSARMSATLPSGIQKRSP